MSLERRSGEAGPGARLSGATLAACAVWMILAAGQARADGPAEASLRADIDLAARHYREAVYHSDPLHGDPAVAQASLADFRADWNRLALQPALGAGQQFAGEYPGAIADIAARADQLMTSGKSDQAHAALQEIRPLLASLARPPRGNDGDDCAFADWMGIFDDKLAEAADDDFNRPELAPSVFVQLCEQAGVLDFLTQQLARKVPARYAEDAAFLEAQSALTRQVRGLRITILEGRRDPVKAALTDLRLTFDRFQLTYG